MDWASWPIFAFFSLYLFNSVGSHILGSILFLHLWAILIPILLIKKGLLLLISQKVPMGLLWALFSILNIIISGRPFINPLPKGVHEPILDLILHSKKYSSFLSHCFGPICVFSSLWAFENTTWLLSFWEFIRELNEM